MMQSDGAKRELIELNRQEANRVLMALTIRRNKLREDGYDQNAEEYTDLCQRIARKFDTESGR